MQIVAVILTYNRKELLKRCLDAVYAQTRPCDSVIVIDNASQDDTQQMLLGMGHLNLKVYVLSHNVGASGGFNAGFRLAYQQGADFVWMMDDDVIPEPEALQRLVEAEGHLQRKGIDRAFLLSTALTEKGLATNTPEVNIRLNKIGYVDWPEMIEHGMVPVRRATFVSILVPRSTLTEHGLPIASMFIWGEDTEYTLRVTQDRPGFMVGTSKVLHLRQENGPISILSERNPARMKYHRHFIRNNIFIAYKHSRHYRSVILAFYNLARLLVNLLRRGQFQKASIVLQGLMESLLFFPDVEAADAPIDTLGVSIRLLGESTRISSHAIDSEVEYTDCVQADIPGDFIESPTLRG